MEVPQYGRVFGDDGRVQQIRERIHGLFADTQIAGLKRIVIVEAAVIVIYGYNGGNTQAVIPDTGHPACGFASGQIRQSALPRGGNAQVYAGI